MNLNIDLWVKQKFGSKKGMLRFFYFQFLLKMGFYCRYKNIDFSKVKRLVFACAGNICRSPFAEAVARKQGVNCMSFGLDTRGGDPADPRAIDIGRQMQLDLNPHVSQTLQCYKPVLGDLLVVMEPQHLQMLPESLRTMPVTLVGLWLRSPIAYLHDPFNTCIEYFERCELLVKISAENIVDRIKSSPP